MLTSEKVQSKLKEALLRKDVPETSQVKRQKRVPPIYNDLYYLDGVRKSVGTVIKDHAITSNIIDYKINYFKTLTMNNVIDISNSSSGSQLDLFTAEHQELIIKSLSSKHRQQSMRDTVEFDRIIEKYSAVEDNNRFLRKYIEETENVKNGDKNKRIYLRILESMAHHRYLYDHEEDNSEADCVNKLYSSMMEACFQGYTPKIVLRVTFPSITCVVEYAKKYSEGEYYKDKVKIVLCSIIYFRNLLKKTNNCDIEISDDNFQTRRGNVNKSWFVLEKVADSGYTPKCRTCKGRGNQKLCQ
ncbi:hypothetical protein MFLAVUS_001662 [Mucor flavus]|uniref:Uncharacterized protein n=1 Tax=Mucor flavus TaxID=439312 RepID=A0ABP9YN30_9FUNG